jgi:hypothetical protein
MKFRNCHKTGAYGSNQSFLNPATTEFLDRFAIQAASHWRPIVGNPTIRAYSVRRGAARGIHSR